MRFLTRFCLHPHLLTLPRFPDTAGISLLPQQSENQQDPQDPALVLQTVAALPGIGFIEEKIPGQKNDAVAAEPVEEKQCRQHRPPIKAPAKVNKDGKAVGKQHQQSQSINHGIAEHACPQELLQQLSPQQHGRKAVQQEVQHEARLPCQHREKPHILRAGIFIDRKVVAEKI